MQIFLTFLISYAKLIKKIFSFGQNYRNKIE